MTAYVDIAYTKLHSGALTPAEIDNVESLYPGFHDATAVSMSRRADGYLSKRYVTPIPVAVPEELKNHIAKLVAAEIWERHAGNPPIVKTDSIKAAADTAWAFIKELATAKDGLAELPMTEGALVDIAGVSKAGPLGSSQIGPYEWIDVEAAAMSGDTSGFAPK